MVHKRCLRAPKETISVLLRKRFYLPIHSKTISKEQDGRFIDKLEELNYAVSLLINKTSLGH